MIAAQCFSGGGGLFNDFLSWRGWTPLARLTYGAYLLHPLVIKGLAGTTHGYYRFGVADLLARWLLNSLLSFGAALALFLLVERPVAALAEALLHGGRAGGGGGEDSKGGGRAGGPPAPPAPAAGAGAGPAQASAAQTQRAFA